MTRTERRSWRAFWLAVHRYVGLTIATFLVVAGLTGSLVTFQHELDALINPHLLRVSPPAPGAQPLDPLELHARLVARFPEAPPRSIKLSYRPGATIAIGQPTKNGWVAFFVDPYTGEVVGSRTGNFTDDPITNLMPFVYALHRELALGTFGFVLFGVVALLWTLDCFVGFYLTLPLRRRKGAVATDRSWLARWKPSWLVKGNTLFGAIFTFHRASGLWTWPLLFVFAWSSVGFNLGSVYRPVMGVLGTAPDPKADLPRLERPREHPALDWRPALTRARELMAHEAERRGFSILEEGWIEYVAARGLYHYRVHSTADVGVRYPGARLWFDGDDGRLLGFWAPTGRATGDTVGSWLTALHLGTVGGVAYRIVVVVIGILVAVLPITGVLIWWRKRRARVGRAGG